MKDRIQASARAARVVLWEEVARDGAQAGTLLLAEQREEIARRQGELFGEHGPDHVIFAAGFPAVAPEELEIVRHLVDTVETCALATHGRARREDVDLGWKALAGARFGRLTFFLPVSAEMSDALLHRTPTEALDHGVDVLRYALDRSPGLPVDIALADASRADPAWVAEAVARLGAEGTSIVKVCDSMGLLLPDGARALFARLEPLTREVTIGAHLHNDLGVGLANTLEAWNHGIRVLSCSWRGLGERAGLPPTEQLLFLLATRLSNPTSNGPDRPLWLTPPDLPRLPPLAGRVSEWLGLAIESTDPIIGPGVTLQSTGTPFLAPELFRCFDAQALLGLTPRLVLTQLANERLVTAVAKKLGFALGRQEALRTLRWVKQRAYGTGCSVVPTEELLRFLAEILPPSEGVR